MLDAKLIISTLTIGVVVSVAINYVGREKTATSVDYTDDWDRRLEFICKSTLDTGSCFTSLCKEYYNGNMDSQTELLIQCPDATYRSATLEDLHSTDDWYERARGAGGNTQAPLHATEEYCEKTEGASFNAAAFKFTGTESESDSNGVDSCAFFVPIFAAVVDAEYTRYVSRSHIAEFQSGFEVFCQLNDEINAGCEEAVQGFRDGNMDFTATCEDGSIARFNFHQTVMELDHMKHNDATDEEVETYIRSHCGNTDHGEARRLGLKQFHNGETHVEPMEKELNEIEDVPELKSKAESLREMLKKQASESRDAEPDARGRALWGHGHNPHGHSPHGHTPHRHASGDAHDCNGCANVCGNSCFGRCGPGCSRWNSCGHGGAGAHRACVEHDYECSCQSIVTDTCLMLMVDGITSTFSDLVGNGNCELTAGATDDCNAASGAPGGSIATVKRVNMAVRTWGERYGRGTFSDGNRNVNSHACSKVNMCIGNQRRGYNSPRWSGSYIRNDCNDGWDSSNRGDGHGTFVGVVKTIAVVVGILFGF